MTITMTAPVLVGAAVAAGTGLHVSTWGAFKDSPFEGFHPGRLVRTLAVAQAAALASVATGLVDPLAPLPAIGVVYTAERLATEWWKTILRSHDAEAFTIPMRLGFRGRPVDAAWRRYAVGAAVIVAIVAVGLLVHAAQTVFTGAPLWLVITTVGGLGGWATALGGAWKDAPIEGFSGWKFLRSPVVATVWAVPCSLLTRDWVTLCLAAAGFAVATIETYKTFMTGDRPPGKFAGREPAHSVPATRRLLATVHASTWLMLAIAGMCSAFHHPGAPTTRVLGQPAAPAASLAVAGTGLIAWGAVRGSGAVPHAQPTDSEPRGERQVPVPATAATTEPPDA